MSEAAVQHTLPLGDSIADKFYRFHEANPHVYKSLVRLARDYKERKHKKKLGIAMLFELLRWDHLMRVNSDDDFKLNNNYRAYYARLIMASEDDLRDVFELREKS